MDELSVEGQPITPTWVVGAGGLLGGAVRESLPRGACWSGSPIQWGSADASSQLDTAFDRFLDFCNGRSWSIAWCAGAGIVGTSAEVLAAETALLAGLLHSASRAESEGTFFLASSAGGVYAGSSDRPITESTPVQPLAEYGRNKLVQESLVRRWAVRTGQRAVVGRIANLYGPGQSLAKQQGLISQVCLSTLTRRPIHIFVSLDTIRDYLFADDCGRLVVQLLARAQARTASGTTVCKLLGSGTSVSVGGILSETARVLRRRPTVVLGSSSRGRLQGSTLTFRSEVWADLDRYRTTRLVGISRVAASVQSQIALQPGHASTGG